MAYEPVKSHEEYLEILEKFKDYKKNTYQTMSLEEKIDFFDGIHTDHVPMFDEDGDDTLWTLWDYGEICTEFIQHPEMFSVSDISTFLEMLDDECYQPSFMDDTLKVIRSIVRFYGKDGAGYLLAHLTDVPQRGKEYGLCDSLRYLLADDTAFLCLKEAVSLADTRTRELLLQIIRGEIPGLRGLLSCTQDVEREKVCELEKIAACVREDD